MDSPFGRLDPVHKENIVRYLPDMAEQSMLLAYIGEIDAQVAHEALKEVREMPVIKYALREDPLNVYGQKENV